MQLATVTLAITGFLTFIQSRKRIFTAATHLWKKIWQKPHKAQRIIDTHYLDFTQALGGVTLPSLTKQIGRGWLGAMATNELCDSSHKATANTQGTYAAQESRNSKLDRFSPSSFSLIMTSSCHIPHKFFLLPPPTYPLLLSCQHINICTADFYWQWADTSSLYQGWEQANALQTTSTNFTTAFKHWQLIQHIRYSGKTLPGITVWCYGRVIQVLLKN